MIKNKKEILAKYPFLKLRDFDGSVYLHDGEPVLMHMEIPKGWYKVFFQMCDDIKPILEKEGKLEEFYFIQVKEKFNGLRCYSAGASEEVHKILDKYEYMASYICTNCGKPATIETTHYIASFCDDCWKDKYRHQSINFIKFKPFYQIERWSKEKDDSEIITISFEEEWNRYLASL